MKTFPGIDYEQRPESYWEDENVLAALLRDVKGTNRRRMIMDYWNAGQIEELNGELLQGKIPEELRQRLGRMDPSFMGGEYLPDPKNNEVEIARMELESTTSDVISIRATRRARCIRYRIVTEYEWEHTPAQRTSRRPLTLRGMVRLLEESGKDECKIGLAMRYNVFNAADGLSREDLRHFTRISSDFYPDLEEHFEQVFEEWVEGFLKC